MMFWISSLSLKSFLYSILRVSSFCQKKVVSYIIFSTLLNENSSSKTQKNSPTGLIKVRASMVGKMFVVVTMSCWRKMFTKIHTGSGLLGTFPWCAMAACSVAWEAMVVA
jgi:hypothetical protein